MKHLKHLTAIFLAVIMTFSLCAVAFATDIDSHMGERTLTLQLGKQNAGVSFHLKEDSAYSRETFKADDKGVVFLTLGDSTDVLVVSDLAVAEAGDDLTEENSENPDTAAPVDADNPSEGESESESEVQTEDATEAEEEKPKTILGMKVSSFIIFIVGLVAVGGYFIVDKVYLKKKNQETFGGGDDDYDDDYDE